jgi:hypothetical protein
LPKAAAKPELRRTYLAGLNDEVPAGFNVLFRPHPGPQTEVLLAQEDEILFGGARGGGKTQAGIIWLVTGNPCAPKPYRYPADVSYVNHPNYRALVLRRNYNDMGDWIDKAKRIFQAMGAEFKERPLTFFEFPTGAKIVISHLDDRDTYEKYLGQEFHRLLLEEATLIPDLKSYKMVRSCLRSVYPELRTQALLTANPGNAGMAWVRDRFVKIKVPGGGILPPKTRFTDPVTGQTRIFIPSRLKDNPTLMQNDPGYINTLMDLPEAERRAMLDGDWDALSGLMFSEFRPTGPLIGEPEQARHVIPAKSLNPWLNRSIGFDWGYSHEGAAYWICDNDDQRIHVYRELVRKQTSAESWGAEIALASLEDLRGIEGGVITCYLSPDAWDKRNDVRAIADQVGQGIAHVLGAHASLVLTEAPDSDGGLGEFITSLEDQKRFGIVVRKASNQRVAGVQYIRSLLRWRPITRVEIQQFDINLFIRLLNFDSGRAMDYRDSCARQERPETLPGVLIHDCCPHLIESISTRQRDDKNSEDVMKVKDDPLDNPYDAFRYAVFSHSKHTVRSPLRIALQERLEAITADRGCELDGNTKVWIARHLEEQYAKSTATIESPINFPRAAGRRAKLYKN